MTQCWNYTPQLASNGLGQLATTAHADPKGFYLNRSRPSIWTTFLLPPCSFYCLPSTSNPPSPEIPEASLRPMRNGVKRGFFSNEACIGSAPASLHPRPLPIPRSKASSKRWTYLSIRRGQTLSADVSTLRPLPAPAHCQSRISGTSSPYRAMY